MGYRFDAAKQSGRRLLAIGMVLALAGSTAGCGLAKVNTVRENYVRDVAALQFECTRGKMDVRPLDDSIFFRTEAWSVEGCGEKAIYRLTEEGPTLKDSYR